MKLTQELIELAKKTKTVEELGKLVRKNGVTLTDEETKKAFEEAHHILSDEELDNVDGGTCYSSGTYGPNGYQKYAIVTAGNKCYGFTPDESSNLQVCAQCAHSFTQGATLYCAIRTQEHDPHKL